MNTFPPAADAIALLTEYQANEYLRTCNDEEPDELIGARHGEPDPLTSAPCCFPATERK